MVSLRNTLLSLAISARQTIRVLPNRFRGHTFIPHPLTQIFIEPVTYCNLECKFCTYRLHRRPEALMEGDRFRRVVEQALEFGFRRIVLTPINGDVFIDKGIMGKLRFLEGVPGLEGVVVYTNFIAPSAAAIAEVASMGRLALFNISIYGHDFDSFQAITGRGHAQFDRLVANLHRLADLLPGSPCAKAFQVSLRAHRGCRLDDCTGPLAEALRRLNCLGVDVAVQSRCDDWGGLIGDADMKGLGMELVRGRLLAKQGACILPFYSIQVLADGRVNACACRDVDAQLQIGDLNCQPLAEVLSPDNAALRKLIEGQQEGSFPPACRGCSFYRSIHDPAIARASPLGTVSIEAFWGILGARERESPYATVDGSGGRSPE